MARLDVGIIGCGLVAQVEHLPNLIGMPDLFQVIGVADPSQKVREHLRRRWDIKAFTTAEALLDRKPDAVIIAAPDAYHADLAIASLDRGIHVFLEKPVCYDPADAERLIAARDNAQRIVQIGYMKRFDPAFRFLRNEIQDTGSALRLISVEVNDPDYWPYVAHRDYVAGDDVPPELIAEAALRRQEQIAGALGRAHDRESTSGFAGAYCSALVHDVNLVHGLLEAMGGAVRGVIGAALFAGGEGGHASARLAPADAVLSMTWVATPKLADYSERVALVFDDRLFELRFPSPYLNHQQTDLIEHQSSLYHHRKLAHRLSYAEAFVEELKDWHSAVSGGILSENTIEQALRDMRLIGELGRHALAHK